MEKEYTEDELNMYCEWSDYRKNYGVETDEAHKSFIAGWKAARGTSYESHPLV